MRGHFWRLGDDGVVDIADFPAFGVDQPDHMTQQCATVGALELRVGNGEMLADIAQCHRTEQRIAERMQQYVAIGMRQQSEPVRNPHAAERDEIALADVACGEALPGVDRTPLETQPAILQELATLERMAGADRH